MTESGEPTVAVAKHAAHVEYASKEPTIRGYKRALLHGFLMLHHDLRRIADAIENLANLKERGR